MVTQKQVLVISCIPALCLVGSSDVKVSMLLPGAAVDKVTCFWKENRVGGAHDKVQFICMLQSAFCTYTVTGVYDVSNAARG